MLPKGACKIVAGQQVPYYDTMFTQRPEQSHNGWTSRGKNHALEASEHAYLVAIPLTLDSAANLYCWRSRATLGLLFLLTCVGNLTLSNCSKPLIAIREEIPG